MNWKVLLTFIILQILLVLASMTLIADQPAVITKVEAVTADGWLNIVYRDPAPDSDLTYDYVVTLTASDGEITYLALPAAQAQPYHNQYVRVVGRELLSTSRADGRPSLAVDVVTPMGGMSRANVSGSQRFINVLCRFADSEGEPPKTPDYFDRLIGHEYPGAGHFWEQVSFGQVNLHGSQTTDRWYTLPHPMAYYQDGRYAKDDLVAEDCVAAADADVDYTQFVGINLMFDRPYAGYALGGGKYFDLDGEGRGWRLTWNPPFSWRNAWVLMHEIGHTFGLPHSGGDVTHHEYPYDSRWDVMSGSGRRREVIDPEFGELAAGTIAPFVDALGWIPSEQRVIVENGDSATVMLEHLHLPKNTTNPLIALVPIDNSTSQFYTVEARMDVGYDVATPGEGVLIYRVDATQRTPANVVDFDDNNNVNDAGAIWSVGETFIDAENGIVITVQEQHSTGYVVTIENDSLNIPQGLAPDNTTLSSPLIPAYTWQHAGGSDIWFNIQVRQDDHLALDEWVTAAAVCQQGECSASFDAPLANGSYTWQVHAYKENTQETLSSSAATFTIGTSRPVAPQNVHIDTSSGRPLITVTDDPNATWFQVYIADESLNTVHDGWYAKSGCAENVCTIIPDAHPANGRYNAYVRAWGPGGFSTGGLQGFTGPVAFTLAVESPGAARPLAVENANSGRPIFTWQSSAGATWYQLRLTDADGNMAYEGWHAALDAGCAGAGFCEVVPDVNLDNHDRYHWSVIPWGPGGTGTTAQSNPFEVNAHTTGHPQMLTPSDVVNTFNPVYSWNRIQNASWYQVEIYSGETLLFSEWLPAEDVGCHRESMCTLSVPDLSLTEATHTWRVRAYGPAGVGDWSGNTFFIVQGA